MMTMSILMSIYISMSRAMTMTMIMCVHLWSGVSPEFAEGDHHADDADAAEDDDDEEEDDNEGEGVGMWVTSELEVTIW